MAINTVYDDGALRVLGGLSAPSVGAGQAFGAGVQQRQEQRKSELGMDAQRLNMDATRQQMRLREEAAKRQAAAAQRQAAAAGRAREQAQTFRNFQQQFAPGVRPMFGGTATSPVPLSFGAAGAGLSGGGSMPYVIGSVGTDTLGTDARFPLGIAAPQDQPAGYGAGQVDPGLMRAAGLALPGAASPVQAVGTLPPQYQRSFAYPDGSIGIIPDSMPVRPGNFAAQAARLALPGAAPQDQPADTLAPTAPDYAALSQQLDAAAAASGLPVGPRTELLTNQMPGPAPLGVDQITSVDPTASAGMQDLQALSRRTDINNAATRIGNSVRERTFGFTDYLSQTPEVGAQRAEDREQGQTVSDWYSSGEAQGIFQENQELLTEAARDPLAFYQQYAKGAPTSRLAKPETGTAGTTEAAEETPPDVTAPVTDIQKGEIVDDPVAQVAADVVSRFEFPARFRLKTLNDPPALNGILTSTAAQRNQLYEQYTAYANAGFMEYANKFIPQIEALDKALDFLEANQALNDAIDYNDPRRLSQVLSQATDLGPVNVVAQRKGDEVVFTINTPGGQPIRPEYTEMSPDTLEKAVRMFVDADYRAQIAAGNAAREEAFSKALGKGQGENLAKAEQALSDAELRKLGIIPREVATQVEAVDENNQTVLIITYTDGTAERVVPSTTDGITTYTRIQMQ